MKRKIQVALGVAVGGVLLWWLFRGTDWGGVLRAVEAADWRWLLVAEMFVLLSFVTRVQRWSYIVRSAKPVRWRSLFSATQIGFLANFTLPARMGEPIRAVVLARLTKLPFFQCFAFVAMDRVTDIFGLIAVMLVAAIAFRPGGDLVLPKEVLPYVHEQDIQIPADAIQMGALFATIAGVGLILCFVVLFLKQRLILQISDWLVGKISRGLAEKVRHLIESFAAGLHVFRSKRDMGQAISFSLLTWLGGVIHFQTILLAFGMHPPWYAGFVVMALLSVAVSIPGPPGFVGPFHIAVVGAILVTVPGTDLNVAKATAIVAHLMNLLTVVVVGLWCLYTENFGLMELQREAGEADEEDEDRDDRDDRDDRQDR